MSLTQKHLRNLSRSRLHAFVLVVAMLAIPHRATAGPIIWGPAIGDLQPTAVKIAWKTSEPMAGKVVVDDRTCEAADNSAIHHVTVNGLKPQTKYTYKVYAGDKVAAESSFRTPAAEEDRFKFVAYGDCRTHYDDHRAVLRSIGGFDPDFILTTGDLVGDGRETKLWTNFFAIVNPFICRTPYLTTLGNHERNCDSYYAFWPLPQGGGEHDVQWYRYKYGDASFIALDSDQVSNRDQLAWLREILPKARRDSRWVICFFHHPPYSSSLHGGNKLVQELWVPLFEKYGVDVCFCGHEHCYERSEKDGVTYIVTGGGGAPRYPVDKIKNPYEKKAESTLHHCRVTVNGSTMTVEVVRPNGTVIEQFVLHAR